MNKTAMRFFNVPPVGLPAGPTRNGRALWGRPVPSDPLTEEEVAPT